MDNIVPTPVLRISVLFESNTDCTGNVAVRLSAHRRAGHIAHRDPRIGSVEASINRKFAPLRPPCEFVGQIGHILNDDRIGAGRVIVVVATEVSVTVTLITC